MSMTCGSPVRPSTVSWRKSLARQWQRRWADRHPKEERLSSSRSMFWSPLAEPTTSTRKILRRRLRAPLSYLSLSRARRADAASAALAGTNRGGTRTATARLGGGWCDVDCVAGKERHEASGRRDRRPPPNTAREGHDLGVLRKPLRLLRQETQQDRRRRSARTPRPKRREPRRQSCARVRDM